MPSTSHNLNEYINGNKQLTEGTKGDYGFCDFLYKLKNIPFPSTKYIKKLEGVYRKILQNKDGIKKLDQAVKKKKLINFLNNYDKEKFDWVVYSGNLFD